MSVDDSDVTEDEAEVEAVADLDVEGEKSERVADAEDNLFIIDPELIDEAGGGPVDPHVVDTEKMGHFIYKEFESVEEL